MSTLAEIEAAAAKLAPQDFAQLLEDLHDLAEARAALAEIEAGEKPASVDEVAARLGV